MEDYCGGGMSMAHHVNANGALTDWRILMRCTAAVAQIQRHGGSEETLGGGLIPQCSRDGGVGDLECARDY